MISVLASVALFLAVPAGHTLFWIGLVNRAHAIDLGHDNLHRLHKLHNVAIVGAAVAWFIGAGLFGPRLLRGGTWRDLSGPMALFALGCCVVATGWGICWLSRRLAPRPRRILSRVATRRDLEPELSAPARGVGPYQKLLNVPGNEFLHLEIVELELRLPRLPPEWDGLSIVHLSDIHLIGTVGLPYFERLFEIANSLNGDLVAFTGDLLDDPKLVAWLDSTFGKSTAPLGCHFILGNHDREWGDIPASRKRLTDLGWCDASSQTRQLEYRGRTLAIAGTER
ncbi:MAG: metallophosphoesterase, partial [Planctomycetota bacterium]|nr:metallophosphoesterase [Planctomycetota bacterium]